MSARKFKRILTFTYFQFTLLSTAVDVVWEAKLPVLFGNVTYLQCKISGTTDNCTIIPRQWIGGPKYGPLCYNDECPTQNKYEVMKPSNCLYTLMIRDFSEIDVNREYTCLYGVSKMRQMLSLNEKSYIYKPYGADIKEEYIEKEKTMEWRVNISKIFPKPICRVDIDAENITDQLQISITKPGFYFATALQINLTLSPCGKLNVYCYLGDYKINITSKNFDSCHLQGGENSCKENQFLIIGVIMLTLIPLVSVFTVCMCRKKEKLCFDRSNVESVSFQLVPNV